MFNSVNREESHKAGVHYVDITPISREGPRIYGAGLLSSIGEAAHCLTPAVRKLPFAIEASQQAFDIASMQP